MATFSSADIKKNIAIKPFLITLDELNQIGQDINLVGYDPQLNLTSDDTNIVLKYDVPSSPKILNYVEPYNVVGIDYTLFYTEVNSGFKIGDRVFIINGSYDSNLLIKQDKYKKGHDGYKVVYIDNCKVVLDIEFNGILPSNDVGTSPTDDFDEFIKIYYIKDQNDFIHVNRQLTTRNLTPNFIPNAEVQFKFNIGQNNIIYTGDNFSPITNTWGVSDPVDAFKFYIKATASSSWIDISNDFMSGSYSNVTTAAVSNDKILILNGSFIHNGVSFKEDLVYKWETIGTQSSWQVNVKHENNNVPILTRSNFRDGTFDGIWNGGLYGTNDKRIYWSSTSSIWNSGTLLNTIWTKGIMNSIQSQPLSFMAELGSNNLPYQKSTNLDNDGFGYNFVINSDIQNAVINNGNVSNSTLSSTSSLPIVEKHLKGELTDELIRDSFNNTLVNKAFFDNCGIFNANIEKSIIKNSRVDNSRLFSVKSINSHYKRSLFKNSNYISDNIIKILNFNRYKYTNPSNPAGATHIIYKFYINKANYQKFKLKDVFYIKGIKINNSLPTEILNFFDRKFKIGPWQEYDDVLSGVTFDKTYLEYNAFISTPKENEFQYDFNTGVNEITIEDNYGYSVDISIQTNLSLNNYYYNIGDYIDFSNAYILNSDFESGVFENSNWNSGNYINYNHDNLITQSLEVNGYYDMTFVTTSLISNTFSLLINNINGIVTGAYNEVEKDYFDIDSIIFLNAVDYDTRGKVTNIIISASGSNYTNSTLFTSGTLGSSGTGLEVDIIANEIGAVLSFTVSNYGSGWTTGTYYQLITSGNGSGISVDITADTNGSITNISILNKGSGYLINDSIEIFNPNGGDLYISVTQVSFGSVISASVSYPGLGYSIGDVIDLNGGDNNAQITITGITGSLTRLPDAYKIISNSSTLEIEEIVATGSTAILPTLLENGLFKTEKANNRYGYLHKTKFFKSKIVTGLFKRAYIKGSLIKNDSFDVGDKDFVDKEKLRTLLISDSIFSSNSNILSKSFYMNSSFVGGSDIWENGILFNSIWNGLQFNNGLVRQSTWIDGTFVNGLFYDSRTFMVPDLTLTSDKYNINKVNSYYKSGYVSATISNNRFSWQNGTFLNGEFYKSNWENGSFENGKFYFSDFYDGVINGGIIGDKSVDLFVTNVYNGTIKYTVVENANFNASSNIQNPVSPNYIQWNDGVFNSGIFTANDSGDLGTMSYATWSNGIFNSGQFKGTAKWKDGTFNEGVFTSNWGDNNLINDNNLATASNYAWENGIFNSGQFGNANIGTNSSWFNGEFNGGYFKGRIWNNGIFSAGDFQGSGLTATGGTYSLISSNANIFTKSFDISNRDYYGLWLSGYVADVKGKFIDKELYTEIQRFDTNKSSNLALLKNLLWVSGTFSHAGGILKESVWLDGTFEKGTLQSSSFNPYVVRNNSSLQSFNFNDSCIWNNGDLIDSEFFISKWNNGHFISGTAVGAIWENGITDYMNAYNVLWQNGLWRNGNWNGSYFNLNENGSITDDYELQILNRGISSSGTSSMHVWNLFYNEQLSDIETSVNFEPTEDPIFVPNYNLRDMPPTAPTEISIVATSSEAAQIVVFAGSGGISSLNTYDLTDATAIGGYPPLQYTWTQVSGLSCIINNVNGIQPTFTGLDINGTYSFKLTATDTFGNSKFDTVDIIRTGVQLNVNIVSVKSIDNTNLGVTASSVVMFGVLPYIYSWNYLSGPSNIPTPLIPPSITNGTTSTAYITNLTTNGTYSFNLLVTDQLGLAGNDTLDINVTNGLIPLQYTFTGATTSNLKIKNGLSILTSVTSSNTGNVTPFSEGDIINTSVTFTGNMLYNLYAITTGTYSILLYTQSTSTSPFNYGTTAGSTASFPLNEYISGTYSEFDIDTLLYYDLKINIT